MPRTVPPEKIPDAARHALEYIDPDGFAGYDEWQVTFRHGFDCLKDAPNGERDLLAWSAQGTKFQPNELDTRREGYKNTGKDPDAALGALFNIASKNPSYVPYGRDGAEGGAPKGRRRAPKAVKPSDWEPSHKIDMDGVPDAELPAPTDLDPAEQMRRQLKAMFGTGDLVMVTTEGAPTKPGHWRPVAPSADLTGDAPRSGAATLAEQLDRAGEYANAGTACGGYVVVNPLDGLVDLDADGKPNSGCTAAHADAYRNLLVECDPDEPGWGAMDADAKVTELRRQARALLTINLPIAAMTYSGGKSVHAVVRVDAKDEEEFKNRARFVYGVLKDNGFATLDPNCKGATRWTRLAGATRGDMPQTLIGTDMGAADFGEWCRWLEAHSLTPVSGDIEGVPTSCDIPWRDRGEDRGRFRHYDMASFLIEAEHFRFIEGTPSYWDAEKGRYRTGMDALTAHMVKLDKRVTAAQRREVVGFLTALGKPGGDLWEERGDARHIAFLNGVVDWRTGELMENRPDLNVPAVVPHDFDPDAECPELDEAITSWACGDPDVERAIVETAALCLYTGDAVTQAVLLTNKDGNNGKSTFMRLLEKMVGIENTASLHLEDIGARFSTCRLDGVLANLGDDVAPSRAMRNPTDVFKSAVSHELISAEEKGQPVYSFRPFCNFVFSCNGMPNLEDRTGGMRRRWAVVPFNNRFEDGVDYGFDLAAVTSDRACRRLICRAVEALPDLVRRGAVTMTDDGRQVLALMMAPHENALIDWFVDGFAGPAKFDHIEVAELYGEFCRWFRESNEPGELLSRAAFPRAMRKTFDLTITTTVPHQGPKADTGRKARCFKNGPHTLLRMEELKNVYG